MNHKSGWTFRLLGRVGLAIIVAISLMATSLTFGNAAPIHAAGPGDYAVSTVGAIGNQFTPKYNPGDGNFWTMTTAGFDAIGKITPQGVFTIVDGFVGGGGGSTPTLQQMLWGRGTKGILYVADSNGYWWTYDAATGAKTQISGPWTSSPPGAPIYGMATDGTGTKLYQHIYDKIKELNAITGVIRDAATNSAFAANSNALGQLAYDGFTNTLIGLGINAQSKSVLYRINPNTGVTTSIPVAAELPQLGAVIPDSATGLLYAYPGTNPNSTIYQINPTTGAYQQVDLGAGKFLQFSTFGPARFGSGKSLYGIAGTYPNYSVVEIAGPYPFRTTALISDEFNDGNIATNTLGTGNGFTLRTFDPNGGPGAGGTAIESGSIVTLSGPSHTKNIQSNDVLNPTGTNMTWVINSRPGGDVGGWVNGASVAWLKDGALPWTYCALLELRNDRVIFDILPANNWAPPARYINILAPSTTPNEVYSGIFSGPVTASIYMGPTGWRVDVTGAGVDIHKSGGYTTGYGLNELLAVSGGTLRASGSIYTWGTSGTFDSVKVIPQAVAPQKSDTTTSIASSQNPSTYGQTLTFAATVTSGTGTPTGTVQFKIDGTNFGTPVTLSGGSATSGPNSALSVGSHTVSAVYSGDSNFNGSTSPSFTQTVNKAPATVTLNNMTQTYTGSALMPSATTTPAGLAITWTGAPQTNAGAYPVTVTINDANYQGSATGTFTINKATATVTLSNLGQVYDGNPRSVTVSTVPSGLSVSVTYDGSPTAPTNTGSYAVAATVTNPNYTGSASGTLNIIITYDGLGNLVRQFVTKQGIVNSLLAKLDNAQKAEAKGNANAKAGMIGAFINEVEAQTGKAISPENAAILIRLARAL